MRFTACQAMADWSPENGAGNESSTRPGAAPGATSLYQRGSVTGLHGEGQALAEDDRHGHQRDAGGGQRTDDAAPVGQRRGARGRG